MLMISGQESKPSEWERVMSSKAGLDGVIAAETTLSHVDGEGGRLIVRGMELRELVAARGFEGVAALLWEGLGAGA